MKTFCLAMLLAVLAAAPTGAEEPASVYCLVKPRTNYEAFVARDGTVQVKQIFQLRAPPMRAGRSAFDLIRVNEPMAGHGVIALRVTLGEKEETRPTGYLDEDEIDALAKALDYMQKNRAAIMAGPATYTEATFRGRGGVEAGLMIKDQTASAFIRVNGQVAAVGDLDGLARTIGEAQAKIAELKK